MTENTGDPNRKGVTLQQVLDILDKGAIAQEHGMMRWSSNYTFLISIKHEADEVMSVYKPQRGERPLWDFPDGTLCYRERAAFLTSQTLGWQLVPPTVLREGPRGLGSFQFFIDHDPDVNYFSFDETMIPQLMRLAAFDYIVNNADRKGGHCLLDSEGHIWAIDHGITFHAAPKLRTVIWDFAGKPIPDALLTDLENLCQQADDPNSPYREALTKLLLPQEIASFQGRVNKLLRAKKYPQPGPNGPNYPWPPV